MEKLFEKIIIKGTLKCITGLHIGDSKDNIEIGGVDNPVVRRKDNNQPYIPGSSIKGKMRSLLQHLYGEPLLEMGLKKDTRVSHFFGGMRSKNKVFDGRVSRFIVRDADLTNESVELLLNSNNTDMPFTEQKYENSINRETGTANSGVRNQERVPAGSYFDVEFVINIYGKNLKDAEANKQEFLKMFNIGIKLLESDYIGGSGTRGYGQVKFNLEKPETTTAEEYKATIIPKDWEKTLKTNINKDQNAES